MQHSLPVTQKKRSTARVFTREQIRGAGLTDRQIERRKASGELVAERRGVFTGRRPGGGLIPLPIEAALIAHRTRSLVVSHLSAARVLRLPEPVQGWGTAAFTSTNGTTRNRDGVTIRVAPLGPGDVVLVAGVAVTSPSRTVVDCLRVLAPRDALAIADAAWNRGLVTRDSLLTVLAAQAGWPGVVGARRLVALADPLRESPLESWSAWALHRGRVVMPDWQTEIYDAADLLIGRVDCWWPAGVAGEADGRAKYALATAQRGGGEQSALDVLHAERRRESELRAVGVEVVRWTAADVLSQARTKDLVRRIRGALVDAHRSPRFVGRAAPYSPRTP